MEYPNTRKFACVSRNTKTLGLQQLQLSDMAASSGPPDGARAVHYKTDELLTKQHTVSDGQATFPIKEQAKHAQSLSCLCSYLTDVCRPGQQCIKGHPKTPCCFDPLKWVSEKLDRTGLLDASRNLREEHSLRNWNTRTVQRSSLSHHGSTEVIHEHTWLPAREHFILQDLRFRTAVSVKMAVFWVAAPCSLIEVYQRFRGPCCLHHQITLLLLASMQYQGQ
jgi:hypothetical protein